MIVSMIFLHIASSRVENISLFSPVVMPPGLSYSAEAL